MSKVARSDTTDCMILDASRKGSHSSLQSAINDNDAAFPAMDALALNRMLDAVTAARSGWRGLPLGERQACFSHLAASLENTKNANARLITTEFGKPISEAQAEVDKCVQLCRHLANLSGDSLKDRATTVDNGRTRATIRQEPVGTVLVISPSNYPFWQPLRSALPALLAGNGIILKHASSVPRCALALEALIHQAGFPIGIFRTCLGRSNEAKILLSDPRVSGVAFTGNSETGSQIGALAGLQLKPVSLMLSGNDPCLVFADADIERAATLAAASRMQNAGQACIAAQRMIVLADVATEFTDAFVGALRAYEPGDPFSPSTRLGPLASEARRNGVHAQVERSLKKGGKLLCGGTLPALDGAYYPPTVIAGAAARMPVWDEEIFGPVAGITVVETVDEAIAAANDSPLSLGASIFSADQERATAIARERLHAPLTGINRMPASYPELPFGGTRASGIGHELGPEGLLRFVRASTILCANE